MAKIVTSSGDSVLVDDADLARISQYTWHSDVHPKTIYAQTNIVMDGKKTTIRLHRLLVDAPDVDHRDGDGLNNRRSNLRASTRAQNIANKRNFPHTSKYKGVSKVTRGGKWNGRYQVHIRGDGKNQFLGIFISEIEAARAYDTAARRYFGEFARLNFLDGLT